MKKITICFTFFIISQALYGQKFEPFTGSLNQLNNQFHKDYNELVAETVHDMGGIKNPVMVFTGDTLVFLFNRKRNTVRIIPIQYHQLKAIDHLPLAIFTLTYSWPAGKLSEKQKADLENYLILISKVKTDLISFDFSASLLKNQEAIIHESSTFLKNITGKNFYDPELKKTFLKNVSPLLMINTDEAARLELMHLHEGVSHWKKEMDTSAFRNLYVVIGSSHQARYREASIQYFDRLLHEKSGATALLENHIVVAESVFDEKGCLSLLARHIIDRQIGGQFFGDPYRMQRDLLSDAAAKYLKEIFPDYLEK